MSNTAALLGGLAAAAPGLAQGGQALATNIGNYMDGNTQGVFGNAANQLNQIQLPSSLQFMGDQGAPPPDAQASPLPTAAPAKSGGSGGGGSGGLMSSLGSIAGAFGLEKGGIVPDHLDPRHRAANVGALGSGVVPASTTGQVLTFDQGGVVPGGNSMSTSPDFQQAQTPQVPMTGPAAGFVQGFGAGQAIGRNLLNAWNEHKARSDAANYADAADQYGPGHSIPDPSTNSSPIGALQDHVEQFFQHLHDLTLGDNHQPNHTQGVPDPATQPIPGSGPQPAQAIPLGQPAQAQQAPPPGGAPAQAPPAAPKPPGGPGGPPAQMGGDPTAPPPGQAQAAQQGMQKGMTTAAVQQGAQQAQQDAASGQLGGPSPKDQSHSLTTNDYDNLQKLKMRAVHSAIMAGKDPNTVYNSMNALETAHFQSQIMRYMGGAQIALQQGDMDAVQKALKNANYYLPNGQDLNMKKATQADVDASTPKGADGKPTGPAPFAVGDLMMQSPTFGMAGHQGPEWQPVNQQTLAITGQALLDPTKVQDIIAGTYKAQTEAQYRQAQAHADLTNANARWVQANGIADWRHAQAAFTTASTATRLKLMQANGELDQAKALKLLQDSQNSANKGPKVTAGAVQTASKAAGTAVDNALLGPQVVVNDPIQGQKVSRDPTKVDPAFANFNAAQQNDVRGLAQGIGAANVGSVSAQDAASIAAQIVRFQAQGGRATHVDVDGKTYKNYFFDSKTDTGHIWIPAGGGKGHWRTFQGSPNIASAEPGIDASGGGGETGASDGSSGDGAASNDDIQN